MKTMMIIMIIINMVEVCLELRLMHLEYIKNCYIITMHVIFILCIHVLYSVS